MPSARRIARLPVGGHHRPRGSRCDGALGTAGNPVRLRQEDVISPHGQGGGHQLRVRRDGDRGSPRPRSRGTTGDVEAERHPANHQQRHRHLGVSGPQPGAPHLRVDADLAIEVDGVPAQVSGRRGPGRGHHRSSVSPGQIGSRGQSAACARSLCIDCGWRVGPAWAAHRGEEPERPGCSHRRTRHGSGSRDGRAAAVGAWSSPRGGRSTRGARRPGRRADGTPDPAAAELAVSVRNDIGGGVRCGHSGRPATPVAKTSRHPADQAVNRARGLCVG